MAKRRMFSPKIISSARFLKMPPSTQALYFHLGLNADDDGVVEAFTVMRMIGSTEDDIKVLHAKNLVKILNDDLVAHITDWIEHNKIRSDRKVDSVYKNLLLEIVPDAEVITPTQRADRVGTSQGRSKDGLGKDRLGKDRLGKSKKKSPSRKAYGIYKNVLLTDEQYSALLKEFPVDYVDRIDRVGEYCESTGKTYKNYLATIRAWARKEDKAQAPKTTPTTKTYEQLQAEEQAKIAESWK